MGALTRNSGATVNFTLPTQLSLTTPSLGSITTPTANGYGTGSAAILGGYAVVTTNNNITWATSAGNGSTPGAIGALPQSAYTANTFGSNIDSSITTSSASWGSSATTNSLYFNTPSGQVGGSGTLTINSGGVLVGPNVGPTTAVITGVTTSANVQNDLIVNQQDPNQIFFMPFGVTNNGANSTSVTKTGPGTLVLLGDNSSGTMYLNQGVVAAWENYQGAATQIVFTGNATIQLYTASGAPSTTYVGNLVKTIDAGVTATFDNIATVSSATAFSESNGYYTGPGSLAIISSFGKTTNGYLILGGVVTADGNSYGGSTTLLGTTVTARYTDPTGNINRFNANAPFYMGGVLQIQASTTASGNPATVQTLGSNWDLIPDTASTLTSNNALARSGLSLASPV